MHLTNYTCSRYMEIRNFHYILPNLRNWHYDEINRVAVNDRSMEDIAPL